MDRSKILQDIIADLPGASIGVTHVQCYRWAEGEHIGAHAHDELYQLDLFNDGRGVVQIEGADHALGGRGRRLSFIPPHTRHGFTGGRRLRSFGFKARIDGCPALARVPAFCVAPPSQSRAEQLERDLRIILEEWQVAAPGSALAIRSRILTALLDVLRIWSDAGDSGRGGIGEPRAAAAAPASREIVRDACRYLAVAYGEPSVTIAKLARHCGIRADSLSRAFRRNLGLAPRGYLMNLRLKQACVLLKSGATVKETAQQTGFGSIHYFSRAFTRAMRQTPSAFKAMRKGQVLKAPRSS